MDLKITEGMVLALLGKGMVYEIEDMDMEYDIKVPMDIFAMSDENAPRNMDIHITMKVSKMKFEIQKG